MCLFLKIIIVLSGLTFVFPDALAENSFANQVQGKSIQELRQPIESYKNHNLSETQVENCTPAAINEFPSDGLTREQRKAGWVIIHVLLTAYCFIILSIVCDDYFVSGIQTLVKRLQLSEDVAGASFMAITSASPELFINCVGTFITEGDIGVGTVVGSNVFNILAAPACCGLFAKMAFQFDWYSILRDGIMYAVSVIMLIVTLSDDKVYWYEALAFVLAYCVYIAAMYFDKIIQKSVHNCCGSPKYLSADDKLETAHENKAKLYLNDTIKDNITNGLLAPLTNEHLSQQTNECLHPDPETSEHYSSSTQVDDRPTHVTYDNSNSLKTKQSQKLEEPKSDDESSNIWIFPTHQSTSKKLWWVLTWPIGLALKYTVPDCRKREALYPFTLLMCMCWIGSISYLLAWLITAIGDTISIPDSVMGLSFLAVGSSMPEIVTCIIVSKQGQGIMGMSSALGANTFEVLLCLGLPWLIKSCFYPKVKGSHWIDINSSGLAYNATCLLSTLVFLYICFFCNRFRLDWKLGLICLIMYAVFLVVGTLIELNVFFPVNLPTCT